MSNCTFCHFSPEAVLAADSDIVALPHPAPVTSCHIVIAPRRHTPAFYDLDVVEQSRIWEILGAFKARIALSLPVDRFDVGFVDGGYDDPAAHAYIHLIPRTAGDRVNLPSGAQWVDLDS